MSHIFKMGSNDYTNNITVPSYKMNQTPTYREYTDCNYTVHREIARQKISGSFTVFFTKVQDFKDFMSYIQENTLQDGSILVSAYVNNLSAVKDFYAYLECTPASNLPYYGSKEYS